MPVDTQTPRTQQAPRIFMAVIAIVALGLTAVILNLAVLNGAWSHHLQDEDALVEMLSALAFFLAAVAGFRAVFSTPRYEGRWIVGLIGLVGFVGFGDEISFGQRLYWWFEPSEPYGVPLDAVHDLFTLSFEFARAQLSTAMLLLAAAVVALCGIVAVATICRRLPRRDLQSAPGRYLASALLLILLAATIDLELTPTTGPWSSVYALEELFEMYAGVVLFGGALTQLVENRERRANLTARPAHVR